MAIGSLLVRRRAPVLSVLGMVYSLCGEMGETKTACEELHRLLVKLLQDMEALELDGVINTDDAIVGSFSRVLVKFHDMLEAYRLTPISRRPYMQQQVVVELEALYTKARTLSDRLARAATMGRRDSLTNRRSLEDRPADHMFNLSDDESVAIGQLLVQDGVLQTLTTALFHGTKAQKTDAAWVLSHAPRKNAIVAHLAATSHAVDALVELLMDGSSTQKRLAGMALASLLDLDDSVALLTVQDVWSWVQDLKHGTIRQQLDAAAQLRAVAAGHHGTQCLVASFGTISTLARMVRLGSPNLMEAAARTLGDLAHNHPANQQAIAATGVSSTLQQLWSRGSASTRKWASYALTRMQSSSRLASDAPRRTAPTTHVTLLRTGSDLQKSHAATELIRLLATEPDAQTIVASAGAIQPIVELLRTGTSSHKQYAMVALIKLAAGNEANRLCIMQAGALPLLEDLLYHGVDREQDLAAEALRQICSEDLQQTGQRTESERAAGIQVAIV